MAAFGASDAAAAGGSVQTLRTANINVTGSDLVLICGMCEEEAFSLTKGFTWDPDGNAEAMTGSFANINVGTHMGAEMEYLDNPTAANAPVEGDMGIDTVDEWIVFGLFATAADDIVVTDIGTDSFASNGTSLSSTVLNAASGDLLVDMAAIGSQQAMTDGGANQTTQESDVSVGSYLRMSVSTQEGSNATMSWTFSDALYGGIHIAVRIPDVPGAGNPKGPLSGVPLHGVLAGPIG